MPNITPAHEREECCRIGNSIGMSQETYAAGGVILVVKIKQVSYLKKVTLTTRRYSMVRKAAFIGILLVCNSFSSQKIYQSFNPGIKIGYCWGKNSGWVWGPEISYVGYYNTNSFFFGPVCGATFHFKRPVQPSYYVEAECGSVFFGGIALGIEIDEAISGHARLFLGEGGYVSGKFFIGKPSFELYGSAKCPILITQPKDLWEWLGI
jgi:hypothetical protein